MRYVKIYLKRFLCGIPIGVFIGQVVFTIIMCAFKFSVTFDWKTLLEQNLMAAAIGGYCYGTSVIYAVDRLSVLQQTIIQWISLLPFLPLAWVMHWMPRSTGGIIGYIIFYICWILGFWFFYRRKYISYVIELNKELKNIKLKRKNK